MEFVIITGLSGSGKSCAVNVLEDIGYFCVDNMPPQLIPKFAEICKDNESIQKVALVTDIRGGSLFLSIEEQIKSLKESGFNVKLLFVDAKINVVQNRYKETRRRHPLQDVADGDVLKAIMAESEILAPIREAADFYIDTSLTSLAKFRENLLNIFLENINESISISCISFGFKHGIPQDSDLMFDVRCLPNPFYLDELKMKTGLDKEVVDFVMSSEVSLELESKLRELIGFLIPQYIKEGKSHLVIAFGCTGGHHRSVTFAERTVEYLQGIKYKAKSLHRDILK